MRLRYTICFALLCGLLCLTACKRQPVTPTRHIPMDLTVAVAPFTHPTSQGALIMGSLPEYQRHIPKDVLQRLDGEMNAVLNRETQRYYTFPADGDSDMVISIISAPQASGLKYWLQYGKTRHTDLLLVPQILDWHQRQGSSAGVTDAAAIRAEFTLIDLRNGRVVGRSITDIKQEALAEDLTKMQDFFRRKASWITAEELTREAMVKAVRDIGL